jgi:hypothetical protein
MSRKRGMLTLILVSVALLIGILAGTRRTPPPVEAVLRKVQSAAATSEPPLRLEQLNSDVAVVVPPAFSSEPREMVLPEAARAGAGDPTESGAWAAILGREEVLKERDGALAFNSRGYGLTIERGAIEIVTPLELKDVGQPRFGYTLEEIRCGGVLLATGGEAVPVADLQERTVSYVRGSIRERYVLGRDRLEQTFILSELPSPIGDLVITGSVTTNLDPPADRTRGPVLSFTHQGHEFMSVTEAVAIDAQGRRQAADLAYIDGKMQLIVPGHWLKGAALPILVDPMVGGRITIDSAISNFVDTVNSQFVRICDVAYNSVNNNWLVTWCEQVGASSFDYNVLGQRISATGTLVGTAISIAATTAGEYECAVSYSAPANKFLVAWRHDPANNSSATDQAVSARIINGVDGLMPAAAFTVEDPAGQDYAPSAAFDGTNWFVTYTNTVSSTDHNIRGRFVSNAGVPGTSVGIDSGTDFAARSSLAFGGSVYMLVWEKGPSTGNKTIVARTMSTTGTFPTSATTVTQATNDARQPDVSFGGNKFLIAWQHVVASNNRDIYGRIATSTLGFDIAATSWRSGTTDQITPRAAFGTTSSQWYVVYADSATGATNIYGFKVGLTGTTTNSELVSNTSVTDRRPELAYNPSTNEMLVAFLYGSGTPWQLQAQRISMVTPTVPPAPLITTASKKVRSATPVVQGTAPANALVTIYYNTTADGTAAVDGSGNWTYTAKSKAGGTYTVKARTTNVGGTSGDSNAITVTVDLTPPPVPANIRTTSYTNSVDVEWDPVTASDLLGYNVSRKTGTAGGWSRLNTTGVVIGTRFRDSTAINGTTYFYRVTAVDNSLPN